MRQVSSRSQSVHDVYSLLFIEFKADPPFSSDKKKQQSWSAEMHISNAKENDWKSPGEGVESCQFLHTSLSQADLINFKNYFEAPRSFLGWCIIGNCHFLSSPPIPSYATFSCRAIYNAAIEKMHYVVGIFSIIVDHFMKNRQNQKWREICKVKIGQLSCTRIFQQRDPEFCFRQWIVYMPTHNMLTSINWKSFLFNTDQYNIWQSKNSKLVL